MIVEIRKRDGRVEPFDKQKIVNAIAKAMERSEEMDIEVAERIANKIAGANLPPTIDVEKVQDLVEDNLMASRCKKTAKEYITYREKRNRERQRNTKINQQIENILLCKNVQNSNANVDEYSFGGRKFESANVLHKSIALDALIRPEVAQAHRESRIYIHDLSEYDIGDHNCLFADIGRLLASGFATRNGDVRPAGNFATACQLIAVIFQVQSQVQFGGVASCHLDYDLAPYVKKSFYKHYADGCKYIGNLPDEDREKIITYAKNNMLSVDDEYFKEDKDIYRYALDMTEKEGEQAAQSLFHNLNTLESRAGSQIPFTSINYGSDTSTEGRMVSRWLMEASLDGIGAHHLTPIFPISIFKYKKGVSANPDDPNYDLKQLAIKSLSKRIYPNIVNCDVETNVEEPGNPDTECATMG